MNTKKAQGANRVIARKWTSGNKCKFHHFHSKKLTSKSKVDGLVNSSGRLHSKLSGNGATKLLKSSLGAAVYASVGVGGRGVVFVVAPPAVRSQVVETAVDSAAGNTEPANGVEFLGRGSVILHDQGRDREENIINTAQQILRSARRRFKRSTSSASIVITGRSVGRVRRAGHLSPRSGNKRDQHAAQKSELHHFVDVLVSAENKNKS